MTTAKPRTKAAAKDVDVLDPKSNVVTLQSGTQVEIVPLKSRQLFKLLRILTHGVGDGLAALRFDSNDTDSAFAIKMATTLVFAIPEAEDEAIEFVNSMVKPVGLIERRDLDDSAKERNTELWTKVLYELDNPELDDMVTIIEAMINKEAPNLKSLGKRLGQMLSLAMRKAPADTAQTSTE